MRDCRNSSLFLNPSVVSVKPRIRSRYSTLWKPVLLGFESSISCMTAKGFDSQATAQTFTNHMVHGWFLLTQSVKHRSGKVKFWPEFFRFTFWRAISNFERYKREGEEGRKESACFSRRYFMTQLKLKVHYLLNLVLPLFNPECACFRYRVWHIYRSRPCDVDVCTLLREVIKY